MKKSAKRIVRSTGDNDIDDRIFRIRNRSPIFLMLKVTLTVTPRIAGSENYFGIKTYSNSTVKS